VRLGEQLRCFPDWLFDRRADTFALAHLFLVDVRAGAKTSPHQQLAVLLGRSRGAALGRRCR
jgi:hypothetical protein